MIFAVDFVEKIRSRGRRFTLQNVSRIAANQIGIYIFHHRRAFVYVGKSGEGQGIRERLIKHYHQTHNESFRLWIDAIDGDLLFTHIFCQQDRLDDLEKSAIQFLQPITNVQMHGSYKPINKRMEY